VPKERSFSIASGGSLFPLNEILKGYNRDFQDNLYPVNVFAFRGTVLSVKNYEVTWTGENDELQGPITTGIVEAKINYVYSETSPTVGETVRVRLPHCAMQMSSNSQAVLKEGGEFVFITQILDEKHERFIDNVAPDFRIEANKHADVVMGGKFASFAMENDVVAVRRSFFNHDERVSQMSLSQDSVRTANFSEENRRAFEGEALLLSVNDFDREFIQLVRNPELVTAMVSYSGG
jgi:hypothetical protein